MRLEITRRSDLALAALLALVAAGGERRKAAALAEEVGTSQGFLTQAVTPLVAKGWVRSDPGPRGGYVLDADPADISVLSVIETIEGPTETGRCVLEDRICESPGPCALHRPWASARRRLLDDLAVASVASLAAAGWPR
jgi:Rrf2 family protein